MVKIIYPDEHDELVKAAGCLSFYFDDDYGTMKKAASSAFSEKMIRDNAPDKDHFGIHQIAMGSEESYSFNKNLDGWPEDDLRRRHHTFVKHGHYFREHRNSNPSLAIGSIKASAYNEDMDRVELIIHGNKEKCPDIYQQAKEGKEADGSMSARVSHDVCSCCGKKSKSSKEYCTCIKYHGGQWMPKYSKFAYVSNPNPTFFDFSAVANRADRIARRLDFVFHNEEEMKKAASAIPFVFSDERASQEGIILPDDFKQLGCASCRKQYWLNKLAAAEADAEDPNSKFGVYPTFDINDFSENQQEQINKVHSGVLFKKLAARSIVMPLLPFIAYITRQTIKQAAENPVYLGARSFLPRLFRDMQEMEANADLERALDSASLFKEAKFAPDNNFHKMLGKLENDFSVEPGTARIRIMRISISTRPQSKAEKENKKAHLDKQASVLTETQKKESRNIARAYGLYKIAFCEELEAQQKAVDENIVSLVVYQSN